MIRRLLKEILVILAGTLFFLGLCATVGISTSTPPTRAGSGQPTSKWNQLIEDMDDESRPSQEAAVVMGQAGTGY